MRRALSLTAVLLLAGGLSAPAFAQEPQVIISHEMSNQDLDLAELQAFDQVTIANLKMSRRLASNPRLADDESFLRKWPDLNNFFAKYPGSKERLLANPGNYLADVYKHPYHVVRMPLPKKAEAAPAGAAPPAAEAPAAPVAPAAPESAPPPAAPSSNP
jgi:hypothetical protein